MRPIVLGSEPTTTLTPTPQRASLQKARLNRPASVSILCLTPDRILPPPPPHPMRVNTWASIQEDAFMETPGRMHNALHLSHATSHAPAHTNARHRRARVADKYIHRETNTCLIDLCVGQVHYMSVWSEITASMYSVINAV